MVRRLTQTGQTIHVVHDIDGNRIAEYDFDPVAQTATLIREYVWLDGALVAVVENGAVYAIRTDQIGRPVFATDNLGLKVWGARYLPFGGVEAATGANADLRSPANGSSPRAGCTRTGCATVLRCAFGQAQTRRPDNRALYPGRSAGAGGWRDHPQS